MVLTHRSNFLPRTASLNRYILGVILAKGIFKRGFISAKQYNHIHHISLHAPPVALQHSICDARQPGRLCLSFFYSGLASVVRNIDTVLLLLFYVLLSLCASWHVVMKCA